MSCEACGAPEDKQSAHCGVCGKSRESGTAKEWDRSVEALAYEDLNTALAPDEQLLGMTRGRIAGNWNGKGPINPRALFTHYANLGLTANRLLLQYIHARTGQALMGSPVEVPLTEVASLTIADADLLQPGSAARVVVTLRGGETMRIRSCGRLANSARELAEVWSSLAGKSTDSHQPASTKCAGCGRELSRPFRFCPYCGDRQGGE